MKKHILTAVIAVSIMMAGCGMTAETSRETTLPEAETIQVETAAPVAESTLELGTKEIRAETMQIKQRMAKEVKPATETEEVQAEETVTETETPETEQEDVRENAQEQIEYEETGTDEVIDDDNSEDEYADYYEEEYEDETEEAPDEEYEEVTDEEEDEQAYSDEPVMGSYGRLDIPELGYSTPLCLGYGEMGTSVDGKIMMAYTDFGDIEEIAGHNYHGFDVIGGCYEGMTAQIVTNDGSVRNLTCFKVDRNCTYGEHPQYHTDHVWDSDGNPICPMDVDEQYVGCLIMRTCNDSIYSNTVVFWR